MDASEIYPSSWLRAEDIGDKRQRLTIKDVVLVEMKDKKRLELLFTEIDSGLILNKTNANKLKEAFGNNTDGWIDKVVELYTALTTFQGKEMPAIRLKAVKAGE